MIISTNYITQISHVDACLKPVIHQQSKKPGGGIWFQSQGKAGLIVIYLITILYIKCYPH